MILPRPLPEIRFVEKCEEKEAEFRGPVHTHSYCAPFYPLRCVMCINIKFWESLPSHVKWFIALHESFHVVHARRSFFLEEDDKDLAHNLRPQEWEADWYACRVFCAIGFDLKKLSQELGTYADPPYLPFMKKERR